MKFTEWFWLVVEKFPKKARFTLASKLWSLMMTILDDLIEARYAAKLNKMKLLAKTGCNLDKIRLFSRLAVFYQYVTPKDFERMCKDIENISRQVGAWYSFLKNTQKPANTQADEETMF